MSRISQFFRLAFATGGDRSDVPATATGGLINFTGGYGPLYQGNQATDPTALYIERDKFNGLLYQITLALQVLQSHGGAAEWIAASDNGGTAFAYAKGARVWYSDGWCYESLVDGNTDTPSLTSATWARTNSIDSSVPAGSVHQFAYNPGALDGYLYCNGQAVSRTTYARLFARIGTMYGAGDGSTTFNVPEYRGHFLRGFSDGTTVDSGRAFPSGQAATVQAHGHNAAVSSAGRHAHTFTVYAYNTDSEGVGELTGGRNTGAIDGQYDGATGAGGDHTHAVSIASAGTDDGHPTNWPVYYYIKA